MAKHGYTFEQKVLYDMKAQYVRENKNSDTRKAKASFKAAKKGYNTDWRKEALKELEEYEDERF